MAEMGSSSAAADGLTAHTANVLPFTPIPKEGPATVTTLYANMELVMAYLGMNTDKKTFVSLLLHPVVLRGFIDLYGCTLRFPSNTHDKPRRLDKNHFIKAQNLLRHQMSRPEADRVDMFKDSKKSALDSYRPFKTKDWRQQAAYIACSIYWTGKELQAYDAAQKAGTARSSSTDDTYKATIKEFNNLCSQAEKIKFNPRLNDDDVDKYNQRLPPGMQVELLEPHRETMVEFWNRIMTMLQFLRQQLAASNFSKLVGGGATRTIVTHAKPGWWDSSIDVGTTGLEEVSKVHKDGVQKPAVQLNKVECILVFIIEGEVAEVIAEREKAEQMTFIGRQPMSILDPRLFPTYEQFRNLIREKAGLLNLELNIKVLQVRTLDGDGGVLLDGLLKGPAKKVWKRDELDEAMEDEEVAKAEFICTLKPDEDVTLEPVPVSVEDLVQQLRVSNEGDVLTHTEEVVEQITMHEAEMGGVQDNIEEARLAALDLAGSTAPAGSAPNSNYQPASVADVPELELSDMLQASMDMVYECMPPVARQPTTTVPSEPPVLDEDSPWHGVDVDAAKGSDFEDILGDAWSRHDYVLSFNEKWIGRVLLPHRGYRSKREAETRISRATERVAALERAKVAHFSNALKITTAERANSELEVEVKKVGLTQTLTPTDNWKRDPFKRSRQDFINEEYSGIDALSSTDGRLRWIRKAISAVAEGELSEGSSGGSAKSKAWQEVLQKRIKTSQAVDVDATEQRTANNSAMNKDGDEEALQYALAQQGQQEDGKLALGEAVQGTDCVGPRVKACLNLLEAVDKGAHRDTKQRKYGSPYLPKVTAALLASQVTGFVHMLFRTLGDFPASPGQKANQTKLDENLADLNYKGPQVSGGILQDSPGMGKTYTALAFFTWWALYVKHVDADGKPNNRPTLLVVPDGHVIHQWAQAINDYFGDIELIIAKSNDPITSLNLDNPVERWNHVDPSHITKCNPDDWPEDLRYIFDKTDRKASRTIILTSYSTWRTRTVKSHESGVQKRKKEDLGWDEIKEGPGRIVRHVVEHWVDKFAMVLLDEGHVIRNDQAQMHWMIRRLRAPINWFLTATPHINSPADVPAEAKVLWTDIDNRMRNPELNPHHKHWVRLLLEAEKKSVKKSGPWRLWKEVEEKYTDHTDNMRLFFLHPGIYHSLLTSGDYQAMSRWAPHFNSLARLARSPDSRLPGGDEDGTEDLILDDIMPNQRVRTAELSFNKGEAEEFEMMFWHRRASKEYAKQMAKGGGGKQGNDNQYSYSNKGTPPPPVNRPLRHMAYCTASVRLARFNYLLEEVLNQGTGVQSIKKWRAAGLSADVVLESICPNAVIPVEGMPRPSRIARLAQLVYGAPKLREIFRHIAKYVLPGRGEKRFKKLLITEEYPLVAWFFELVLNFLHIPTQVLHSGLSDDARHTIVRDFNTVPADNDYNHSTILILMYTINASGVNLDRDCHRVIVNTAASSAPSELQAWSRVVRVSQRENVEVTRFSVANSHDLYRDSAQANKSLVDLAQRGLSAPTLDYMVTLINEVGMEEVREVLDTPLGQEMLAKSKIKNPTKEDYDWFEKLYELGDPESDHFTNLEPKPPAKDPHPGSLTEDGTRGEDARSSSPHPSRGYSPTQADADGDGDVVAAGAQRRRGKTVAPKSRSHVGSDSSDSSDSSSSDDEYREYKDTEKRRQKLRGAMSGQLLEDKNKQFGLDNSVEDGGMDNTRDIEKRESNILCANTMTGEWLVGWRRLRSTDEEKAAKFPQIVVYTSFLVSVKDKVYTAKDVKASRQLFEWGLRLLTRARFGQEMSVLRLNPYIDYKGLSAKFTGIQEQIDAELGGKTRNGGGR
ncbi:hypothetical protein LTR56_010401 [Elasticomyces elasticus]|nr:hypothetical protein LTR22_024397 [Elasticomyces elasticus]KAK3643027.1 hypothetical protein LTR56_010401 [Elasticomyces elasticus]KAK4916816.1 hypothetical protein LTR49_015260 [Elasticomyces elasticus]KAK5755966.1 hypothetical protein LTS12_013970 [Elasticomyces elasticus]